MALDQATKDAINAELTKAGETGAKILNGVIGFFGDTILPIVERIATNAFAVFMQAYADRILRKNGIDPAAVNK